MYPNLYYVFKDFFGVEWHGLAFLNCFGLFVAIAFMVAAVVLSAELKRKEKQGLLLPREEMVTVGKSASLQDIFLNAVTGFIFGYKILGLFINKPVSVNPQEYIFSSQGNIWGGLIAAFAFATLKWWDKNKQKLKTPESRLIRIWPHDRVGDIIILGLIFGILGAKLFDNFENWDEFVQDPIGRIFSQSGLTFYGGLILAAIAICWFGYKKGIKIKHLVDSAAPALMIAYAVGRMGCQVSGDGDWGVFNSGYISNDKGEVTLANPGDFENQLAKSASYFQEGKALDANQRSLYVTDRYYGSLEVVPRRKFVGPSFLPVWLFAYSYPQNVNKDGILMPEITDEHNRVLPQPVFPTPLYEIIICTMLFLFLWAIRRKITTPFVMFGLYLTVNGAERFLVESIRVNKTYPILGMHLSQAQIIAVLLSLSGISIMLLAKKWAARS
jgi:prolipoprotein diacylglyceryltransferase